MGQMQKNKNKKAIRLDGFLACYFWLPDLGSNQGPTD